MIDYAMSDAEYHSRSELSSTGARRILESPAKFHYGLTHPEPPRTAFDVGSAVHAAVLGVGSQVEILDFDNYRTKAAQEARDAARDAGLIPMLAHDMAPINAMKEAVLAHADARVILEEATGREVSIFANVDGVPSRARFDIYGDTTGGDLKTAVDASPKGFNRAVHAHGLHVQAAWYDDVRAAELGSRLNKFTFIVAEKTPPYLVGVYDLDITWQDIGREKAAQARETWLRCTETGVWGGYPTLTLTCPTWVAFDHDDQPEEINI